MFNVTYVVAEPERWALRALRSHYLTSRSFLSYILYQVRYQGFQSDSSGQPRHLVDSSSRCAVRTNHRHFGRAYSLEDVTIQCDIKAPQPS